MAQLLTVNLSRFMLYAGPLTAEIGPMETEDRWVTPVVREEAGHKTVHFGPNPHARRILAGPVKVKWPDGTEEQLTVKLKKECAITTRMGERYNVTNTVPHVELVLHGARVELELASSGLKVWKDSN